MDKHKFLASGLLEQYVLGLTSPEENEIVEAHLEAFPELNEEVMAMHDALSRYAAMQSIPPATKRTPSLNSEKNTNKNEKNTHSVAYLPNRVTPWIFVAASVFLGSLSFVLWQESHSLQHALQRQRAEMTLLEQHCSGYHYDAQLFALLSHKDTRQIQLRHPDNQSHPLALAYWNPTAKKAFINSSSLLPPPTGKQYQVWADVDGHMVPLALLGPHHKHLTSISYKSCAVGINLTLEPIGGSAVPSLNDLAYVGEIR